VISATARDRPHIPVEMPIGVAGSTLVFAASSVNRSPTLWRYNRDRNRLSEMTRPAVALPSLVCESMTCQAQDGYEVRYDLVRRANHAPDRPAPTLIYGYGGFNAAWMSKGYPSVFTPWILAGGTYVFAHLRGDGTYGRDQWHGGRLEAKQRTFDDVFAVAEDLIARGATASDRLAIAGGSNGGLLVAAAITQRPELFRAAAVLVPVTDLARFGTDRFGEACLVEYGDARDADAARWLRAYSPYHNVVAGARYPDTVIVCGDRDMRTPAWHGRKLAAALRAAGGGNSQVLLRVHEDCGHLTAGLGGSPGRIAEWLGFVMQAVGLRPEEGASHMVPRASSDRA
jgi:prolyl oligopeptidase